MVLNTGLCGEHGRARWQNATENVHRLERKRHVPRHGLGFLVRNDAVAHEIVLVLSNSLHRYAHEGKSCKSKQPSHHGTKVPSALPARKKKLRDCVKNYKY